MRLTVLGTGTARPVSDTPASGVLVQAGETAVLFDIGSGVASKLEGALGAPKLSGLFAGHYHADHWVDLAPLRYRFPWGERPPRPLPVFLPPGAHDQIKDRRCLKGLRAACSRGRSRGLGTSSRTRSWRAGR